MVNLYLKYNITNAYNEQIIFKKWSGVLHSIECLTAYSLIGKSRAIKINNKQTAVKCKKAQDLRLTCDVKAFMGTQHNVTGPLLSILGRGTKLSKRTYKHLAPIRITLGVGAKTCDPFGFYVNQRKKSFQYDRFH